jgi:nitrous oxidase accessory protein NosD
MTIGTLRRKVAALKRIPLDDLFIDIEGIEIVGDESDKVTLLSLGVENGTEVFTYNKQNENIKNQEFEVEDIGIFDSQHLQSFGRDILMKGNFMVS